MTTTAPDAAGTLSRHNVRISGNQLCRPVVLGHGFGCDHTVWRDVAPVLAAEHHVVLFDQVGAGGSDPAAYRAARYGSLLGYAEDLLDLLARLDLGPVAFAGHSGAAMVGVLAAVRRPDLFSALVLVSGSPRYLDDDGYPGGLSRFDVDGMLATLERDYDSWCRSFAAMAVGNPDRPELANELTFRLRAVEPRIALDFSRAQLLADHRAELARLRTPTLVLQPTDDPLVPAAVGEYLHARIAGSRYAVLQATGHFPHLSAPAETGAAIGAFLAELPR